MTREEKLLQEIRALHKEIIADYKTSLDRCIKIGGILSKQKTSLPHGHFINWVKTYLPFSERTARHYMELEHHKDRLKKEKINSLQDAYKLISDCNIKKMVSGDIKKFREGFANSDTKYNNPQSYINRIICGDNQKIMQQMLQKDMGEKYTAVITSPPYNANMNYGSNFDDNKPFSEYIDELVKPFSLYSKLLRTGGRVIYIIGSLVMNKDRNEQGDYNHLILPELISRVKDEYPEFRMLNAIIWDKGDKGKSPLDTRWGSFCSASSPLCRPAHENILIWSKGKFELENITGINSDITEDEFKEWSWSVWNINTYTRPNNPHPCSFPPKIIERILKFYTFPDDLVLDCFSGIGTTAQMCQKHNRRFTMIELNSNYCNYAKKMLKL